MVIRQGDVYRLEMSEPRGSEPGVRRPYVVLQNNLFNESRINTVIVCALTSNLRRAEAPGNVLLRKGEGNLPKASVANVSQLFTVDKQDLGEWVGTLTTQRIEQIVAGVHLVVEPREIE